MSGRAGWCLVLALVAVAMNMTAAPVITAIATSAAFAPPSPSFASAAAPGLRAHRCGRVRPTAIGDVLGLRVRCRGREAPQVLLCPAGSQCMKQQSSRKQQEAAGFSSLAPIGTGGGASQGSYPSARLSRFVFSPLERVGG